MMQTIWPDLQGKQSVTDNKYRTAAAYAVSVQGVHNHQPRLLRVTT